MAMALMRSEATLVSPASVASMRSSVISVRRYPRLESAFWSPPSRCRAMGRSWEQLLLQAGREGVVSDSGICDLVIQINWQISNLNS